MTAARTFSMADQETFARWSGDRNPLHLDADVARRTPFGAPLVHGVHLVLWAVDALLDAGCRIAAIEATLRRPVRVGEQVTASRHEAVIELQTDTGPVATVTLTPGPNWMRKRAEIGRSAHPERGTWPLAAVDDAARALPRLATAMTGPQLAATLAVSAIVGMRCPGERSTLAAFRLRFDDGPPSGDVAYAVAAVDDRFGRVTLRITGGGCAGEVVAFRRPPPVDQPSFATLAREVRPGEFGGTRALVVGGSRGLGEVAAKLLTAGGAEVVLTYRAGAADARRVVDEIVAGGGTARAEQFDAAADTGTDAAPATGPPPTLLAYFATPPIFTGGPTFSPALLARFTEVLVDGPVALVERYAGSLAAVLLPSSVAVDRPITGLAEYAQAKAAAEVAVGAAAAAHGIRAVQPRWPRLRTDQTVSQVPVENADPAGYVLAALRQALAHH